MNVENDPRPHLRISAHHLDNWEACQLYFHRVTNLKYTTMSKSRNLTRGLYIHALLAHYYGSIKEGIETGAAITSTLNIADRIASESDGLFPDDIALSQEAVSAYLLHYAERDSNMRIISVEEKLSKVLFESNDLVIIYEGTMDLIVERDGLILPIDHKSESKRFPVSGLNNQFLGYSYLSDQPRMIRNAIGLQKTLKNDDKFYRSMFSYAASTLAWWKANTIRSVIDLWLAYKREEANPGDPRNWPGKLSSCDNMHRSGCPFRDVCLSDPEHWTTLLDNEFIRVESLYDE